MEWASIHREELLANWERTQQAESLKKNPTFGLMNVVKEYKVLHDYQIWLQFEDGYQGIVDFKPLLGKGIAAELLDLDEFKKVAIESGGGLAWHSGFDICPNSLRELAQETVQIIIE